jgi:hypothetical protein
MSLKNKDDFLMHGVVLQNRMFRPRPAMFHVKHFCVNRQFSACGIGSESLTAHPDVSRETVNRKDAKTQRGPSAPDLRVFASLR